MLQAIQNSWKYNRENWAIGAVTAAIIGLIWLMVSAAIAESERWAKFSEENNCVKVGHVAGDVNTGVGYGMTANGQFGTVVTTSTTPDKTGWKCDDGVTYWR